MSLETALRFVGGVLGGIAAWQVALSALNAASPTPDPTSLFVALFVIVGASFGLAYLVTPYLTTRPFGYLLDTVHRAPPGDMLAGTAGLVAGLLVGALLASPLSGLPWVFGWLLPIVVSLVCGYVGATAALAHRRELFALLGLPWQFGRASGAPQGQRVVVDTSAIIDGRIADITRTGFVAGPLIVPRFVLAEVHRIADSPDQIRRQRGRRGLEVLTRLQKDPAVQLEILEEDPDVDGVADVDAQLVTLARSLSCPILTNDYNLNRVAGLQGVKVLNVNELANAVKSVVLPGEELPVKIIQEGKEFGQGVGYLDDGTMVVVENGRPLLNSTTEVVVSRVLQTVAGRMIFAHPKPHPSPHSHPNGHPPPGRG